MIRVNLISPKFIRPGISKIYYKLGVGLVLEALYSRRPDVDWKNRAFIFSVMIENMIEKNNNRIRILSGLK
jgi:hypothetical protein